MNTASQTSKEESHLLSVRETAQRLGIARRTLEREVARKKFPPPLKIGSKSLYTESDVEAYVAKLKEQRIATA
jgi:excisionase family DNA binding protein